MKNSKVFRQLTSAVVLGAALLATEAAQSTPLATWAGADCATNVACTVNPAVSAGDLTGNVYASPTPAWFLPNHAYLDYSPAVFNVQLTALNAVNLTTMNLSLYNNDCQVGYGAFDGCYSPTWGLQTSINGAAFGPDLGTFGHTGPGSLTTEIALDQMLKAGDTIDFQLHVLDPGNALTDFGLYTGYYVFSDIAVNGTVPEPTSIALFALGMLGLAYAARRKA